MQGYIISGFMVVLTLLIIMQRTGMRKWLGYSNIVDITFTIVMIYLFHGTFSGVVSAAFAGVIFSFSLSALKAVMGYELLTRSGWVYYPPQHTWLTYCRSRLNAIYEWA